ncbi:hypothetical protein BH09CHL1_BH09CHL1_29460 [soil metagenome]
MASISEPNSRRDRNWDELHPWLRAGMVGVSLLAVALAIYWVLWEYWVTNPGQDAATDLQLQLLFGIVIAAFATVLIAGVLGYRAHNESSDAGTSSRTSIRLAAARIESSERANSLLGSRPARIGLTLVNDSDHLETWFRVSIDLPVLVPVWQEFPPSEDQIDRALFLAWAIPQRLNDTGDHWQLTFTERDSSWDISALFQSRGEAAVFPHSSTLLCTLSLPTEHFLPGQTFSCRYRIESAHAAPTEETLVIGM